MSSLADVRPDGAKPFPFSIERQVTIRMAPGMLPSPAWFPIDRFFSSADEAVTECLRLAWEMPGNRFRIAVKTRSGSGMARAHSLFEVCVAAISGDQTAEIEACYPNLSLGSFKRG